MRFWTSDLHFGHTNIIQYCNRPFDDADQMNEILVSNWNSVVDPGDEVMVLGDVALGKIGPSLDYVHRLNGLKKLVPGNHDRCWSGHKRYASALGMYESVGFTILPESLMIHIDRFDVNVCHFPYEGDSTEIDRYKLSRPVDDGKPLLHGHVHDKWAENGRMFNVGVDVRDYRPVPEDRIVEWLNSL